MEMKCYLFSALALTAAFLWPDRAQACGGTFCDANPPPVPNPVPMPVDQTGEDILFVVDGEFIEAHIRVEYEGEAERFAWLVPVPAVPEISIGSETLIQAVADASRSVFLREDSSCGDGGGDGDGDGGGFIPTHDLPGEPAVPHVVWEDTVGSFEVAVLEGGTAQGVVSWLGDNGYQQDEEAPPILQEYLDEGFLFAAFKLQADASVEAIHPVIIRYEGDEPCVPLRLTRIAAKEDMGVKVHFLAHERWLPYNYDHVWLNTLQINWDDVDVDDYTQVLAQAVDEAGGRAFVTDYAGPSEVVERDRLWSQLWDATGFASMDPTWIIATLNHQGLTACWSWGCEPLHPQVFALLDHYLPAPPGMDRREFWGALDVHADDIDLDAWDGEAFAAELEAKIIQPGLDALELVDGATYLTRMSTVISPHEMTVDPIFQPRDDLGDVPAVRTASRTISCDGMRNYDLSGGRAFCVAAGDPFPTFADMPYAERIETIPEVGAPLTVTDNRERIDELLAVYRATACGQGGAEDDDGGGAGADDDSGPPSSTGCGCDVISASSTTALWWIVGLAFARGRRRAAPAVLLRVRTRNESWRG